MPSVRDLRDRIRSLNNTQQITKAMKQVAAAKIRRAETAQKEARPYADALAEMLSDLMDNVTSVDHVFMKPGAAGAPSGVILMTADKGLAGAFNANIIRQAELYRRESPNVSWYTIGNKGRNASRRMGNSQASWALSGSQPKLEVARETAARVTADFVEGKIGDIVLISSKFISMMSQKPAITKIVPITAGDARPSQASQVAKGAVEFAPSPETVLSRLLPKYLEFTLYSAMLETDAAFYAAQLVAMNNATDNAKKLIDELTVEMNNARQAAITKEILEIVGGAEALAR
ncbi:MAG: ATP synthase F1 subunit gamma [Candidatus Eremiobacteraeota bacterium]|nr:ATP synthase F1 subunit gamma [Candidatus Eremiobacteraeota bacterium]